MNSANMHTLHGLAHKLILFRYDVQNDVKPKN